MKRVLVISNNCFSLTNSNGRTLAKLFDGYERESLAQFYISGSPDFDVCQSYYRVSDGAAFKSFVTRKEKGGKVEKTENQPVGQSPSSSKSKKTPFNMLMRELVWKYGRWNGRELNDFLDKFKPQEILLLLGSSGFLNDFAVYVAKKFDIKITVFSTEDYCFKNYNYLTRRKSLLYSLYYKVIKKSYKKLSQYVKKGFFNTPFLCDMYAKEYPYNCDCLFAKSDIDFVAKENTNKNLKVSYLGNLGLNRHIALMEIADAIAKISDGLTLTVYGNAADDVKEAFAKNSNIDYKGFVDYKEVVNVIHESDLLVHAEYNDEFYTKDLRAAFSTKIADSVCSGTPLLIYASEKIACCDFLIRTGSAFVVTDKKDLENVLKNALFDVESRKQILSRAQKTRNKYFVSNNPFVKYFN